MQKKICHQKNEILEYIKDFLWDKKCIKELGGAIIYDNQKAIIYYDNNKTISFILFRYNDEGECDIDYVYVIPENRRNGIFSNMFYFLIQNFSIVTIKCFANNFSVPFFKKHGFEVEKSYKNWPKMRRCYE